MLRVVCPLPPLTDQCGDRCVFLRQRRCSANASGEAGPHYRQGVIRSRRVLHHYVSVDSAPPRRGARPDRDMGQPDHRWTYRLGRVAFGCPKTVDQVNNCAICNPIVADHFPNGFPPQGQPVPFLQ